jgi:hypothetical protein
MQIVLNLYTYLIQLLRLEYGLCYNPPPATRHPPPATHTHASHVTYLRARGSLRHAHKDRWEGKHTTIEKVSGACKPEAEADANVSAAAGGAAPGSGQAKPLRAASDMACHASSLSLKHASFRSLPSSLLTAS